MMDIVEKDYWKAGTAGRKTPPKINQRISINLPNSNSKPLSKTGKYSIFKI